MTHAVNILVDGWKKPRGKVSVKYTSSSLNGWMGPKKRNEQIDIKILLLFQQVGTKL